MRLYSLQSIQQIQQLQQTGILYANWEHILLDQNWLKTYRWMVAQMEKRGIACHGNAPIWAWHSCQKWLQPPTLLTARGLLSDVQIDNGIQVIEFVAPPKLVLLSRYRQYNRFLNHNMDGKKLPSGFAKRMLQVKKTKFLNHDDIQATLPFVKMEWVVAIRPLNLTSSDWGFDVDEFLVIT
jgi:Domain of unknown function (DUF3841)